MVRQFSPEVKAALNTLMKLYSYAIACTIPSLTSGIYADVLFV
jgi:hypothetical protein